MMSDDELVAEMNKEAQALVREWYCNSQHRDELVDEIAVALTAVHCRVEANTATAMRNKCVERVRAMGEQWRQEASKAGRMFSDKTAIATKIVAELESLNLNEVVAKEN